MLLKEASDEDMPRFAFDCKKASNLYEDREEAATNWEEDREELDELNMQQ